MPYGLRKSLIIERTGEAMYKNYLFDLDGTLLPMNMRVFTDAYLTAFCDRFVGALGIDARTLVRALWTGTGAVLKNDGECLNVEVFWRTMSRCCGKDMRGYADSFDDFYRSDFEEIRRFTGFQPRANELIGQIKQSGAKLIIATNPVFPKSATFARIRWAGLDPNDFDYVTVYDNSSACKPNLNYYDEICSICSIHPEDSVMIGNDVDEDMVASRLGFDTFLVTDCLLNRSEKDYSVYRNGSFDDMCDYIESVLR